MKVLELLTAADDAADIVLVEVGFLLVWLMNFQISSRDGLVALVRLGVHIKGLF